MPLFQTEAIILRRTNYGEADRILSLLTPDRGKLSAIAKGIRKTKSKLAGGLELFATTNVTIAEGRKDMGVVTAARLIQFYGNLLRDYERLQLGYDCIKQISRVTETVTEPDFYYLLRDALASLDDTGIDYRLVELWFRLHFILLLGRGLNLRTTVTNDPLIPETAYEFDFQEMAFRVAPKGRFGADHIKLLRLAAVKTPAVLRQVGGVEAVLDDCVWLLRTLES